MVALFGQDDLTVWEGAPVGKGRERHLFLFKETLMLTKKGSGKLPAYEFKGLIDVSLLSASVSRDKYAYNIIL